MKRLCYTLLLCILATGCGTIKLAYDQDTADGGRIYATSEVFFFNDKGTGFLTALGTKENPKDTLYAICITCNKESETAMFKKGNRMGFTLSDGSEIVLKNSMDSYMEVENTRVLKDTPSQGVAYNYYYDWYSPWGGLGYAVPYAYHGNVPTPGYNRETLSYALYLIPLKQLKTIINQGVDACWIEAGDEKFEMSHPEEVDNVYGQLYSFLLEKR